MKLLTSLLLSAFLFTVALSNTYYVSTSGNDSNPGTQLLPWKSVAKVNSSSYAPGDMVLFQKGCIWREQLVPTSSGASGAPITFGSYGTGAKPLILGSTDLSSSSAWSNYSGNIWKTVSILGSITGGKPDVGNLIFNNEVSVGVKKQTEGELASQGDFYFGYTADNYLYLYSVGNPGLYYTHIEAANDAPNSFLVSLMDGQHDVTIDGLDIRYTGANAMGLSGNSRLVVQNCNFSFNGGDWIPGNLPYRWGVGFQLWDGGTDITVRYCTFDNNWDAATTIQGTDAGFIQKRIRIYYNVFTHNDRALEFWVYNATSSADSIFFENNTCLYAGGWDANAAQRPDYSNVAHFWTYGNDPAATVSHVYIRNNLFDNSLYYLLQMRSGWTATQLSGLTIDYNLYYQSTGTCIQWQGTNYTQAQFAAYQSAIGKDVHSIVGDPLFVSVNDYHLQSVSPCIQAGSATGYTRDFDGNPILGAPDIGAYEHQTSVNNTYFVDAINGNDLNPGSQTLPWKTTTKVNSYSFLPGDRVLFRCGEIFGQLVISKSGTSASPTTFSSYGSGIKPIFTNSSGAGVFLNSVSYAIVDGLAVANSSDKGIDYEGSGAGVIIRNCSIFSNGNSGIEVWSGTTISNCLITSDTVYLNGYHGIIFAGHITTSTISHNLVHDNSQITRGHGISSWSSSSTAYVDSCIYEYNEVYGQCSNQSNNGVEGAGIQMDDYTSHAKVRYNNSHDNQGYGLNHNGGTGNSFYYNKAYGNVLGGIAVGGLAAAKITIYNNTFCNNPGVGCDMSGAHSVVTMKNNIFSQNGTQELDDYTIGHSIADTLDYNDYYHSAGGNFLWYGDWLQYSTLAAYQSASDQEASSINADPMFTSLGTHNFTLQAISPCINRGVNVGLLQDFSGNTIVGLPDIGAYEYQGPSPIQLSNFTVAHHGMECDLTWVTTSETNNYGFVIQRQNGSAWDSLAFKAGAGTTLVQHTYNYIDSSSTSFAVYRLKQVNLDGSFAYYSPTNVTSVDVQIDVIAEYRLDQNYPNPFNPTTTIGYVLKKSGYTKIVVSNILGQTVYETPYEFQTVGKHTVTIDGSKLASGTYIYTLQTASFRISKRMVLLK